MPLNEYWWAKGGGDSESMRSFLVYIVRSTTKVSDFEYRTVGLPYTCHR